MIDLGISKMALIGAVALIVIGPEKLPRVARTVGALLGKAQRYVSDVKAEVNRSMELDELRKMKDTVESAAQEVQSSVQSGASDFESQWSEATRELGSVANVGADSTGTDSAYGYDSVLKPPEYKHPKKRWRLKQGAVPRWYKVRAGVRGQVQSGAARVARHRPQRLG